MMGVCEKKGDLCIVKIPVEVTKFTLQPSGKFLSVEVGSFSL